MQLSKQPNLLKLLTNSLIALTSLPLVKKRKSFQQPYRNKADLDKNLDFRFKLIIAFYHFLSPLLVCVAVSERSADI